MITITNIRNVSVNGSPVGALVNAFRESGNPVAVQIALEAYCDGLISSLAAKDAKILEITEAKDAQIADLADFKSRVETGIAQVVAVIQDPAIDPEKTIQTVLAVIAEGTAPEAEKIRAAKLAQLEALKSELGIT